MNRSSTGVATLSIVMPSAAESAAAAVGWLSSVMIVCAVGRSETWMRTPTRILAARTVRLIARSGSPKAAARPNCRAERLKASIEPAMVSDVVTIAVLALPGLNGGGEGGGGVGDGGGRGG